MRPHAVRKVAIAKANCEPSTRRSPGASDKIRASSSTSNPAATLSGGTTMAATGHAFLHGGCSNCIRIVTDDRMTPQYIGQFVKAEIEKWAAPIKASDVS